MFLSTDPAKWVALIMALFGIIGVGTCGCAAEQAVKDVSMTARTVALTLAEKAHFDQTSAEVGGQINNPHYRILAVMVNGVYVDIGADGVQIQGAIRGGGSGPDVPLSDATKTALREYLLQDDSLRTWLADMARRAASQPSGP